MKYVRFKTADGAVSNGILADGIVRKIHGEIWEEWKDAHREYPLEEVTLLAPVCPGKIVGVGANYRSFLDEKKKPYPLIPRIFLKPPTSVIGSGEPIICPASDHLIQFEGELGVVIGKHCSQVGKAEAMAAVCGYTCLNDLTDRTMLEEDGIWTRGKGQDTFAPIGPCISDEVNLESDVIKTRVNGQIRQWKELTDMYFSVPELISFISENMTLLPGDIIATGTPAGAGQLNIGDVIEVEVGSIGILKNTMVGRAPV